MRTENEHWINFILSLCISFILILVPLQVEIFLTKDPLLEQWFFNYAWMSVFLVGHAALQVKFAFMMQKIRHDITQFDQQHSPTNKRQGSSEIFMGAEIMEAHAPFY